MVSRFFWVALALISLCIVGNSVTHAADTAIFRSGDELIVRLDQLDLLRQTHTGLNALLKLRQGRTEKSLTIDLTDAAVSGSLVLDLRQFGKCDGISVTIRDGGGKTISERAATPVPEIAIGSHLPSAKSVRRKFASIEPGSEMRQSATAPKIPLPEGSQLRRVTLGQPRRVVSKTEITFPVVADEDLPLVGSAVVGRQTAAPNDDGQVSLYFTCKKGIYEGSKLSRWQKFLVEVPVRNSWGQGQGDEQLVLEPDDYKVHLTNELAPSGRNMLGVGDNDLGQKGEIDSDDRGRIYWRVEGGGAYVARFDPHSGKFEQPPAQVDFHQFVPKGLGMLNDNLCKVSCTRGRVYFTMCNDTLSTADPGNAHRRRLGGVFSIPQDWSDAAAFKKDIRLHVGSWETAPVAFYKAPPKADADVRKLGACSVTEAGLFITTAGAKYEGGPWRLDLDDQGQTKFFGQVASLDANVAIDGTRIQPTRLAMIKGVPKGRELNPGPNAGSGFIGSTTGEITIPRASVRLLVQGIDGLTLRRTSKHAFPSYEGSPQGIITVRYDLVEKLKSAPAARGALADSLNGSASLGPAFLVTPIPGEADRAIAVCEYTGYPLSILDFRNLSSSKTVSKSFLPAAVPAQVGVGPYSSTWINHSGAQWLYITGYTGMARVQYSQDGKPLGDAVRSDVFHTRLIPEAVDGHRRTSMKKIDGLIPVFGGRLIDSGYGIGDRGGDAFSTGIELFDPQLLGSRAAEKAPSQTAAYLSRCFALKTLQSRLIWNALDGTRRQEVFAASGSVRRELINDLGDKDKALAPTSLDAKLFCYEVAEKKGLRDLYGFSLPVLENEKSISGHIAMSPCRRYVVILTQGGAVYTYSIAQKQFVDGLVLTTPSGMPVPLMEFHRPSEIIFSSPDGRIFFLAAPVDTVETSVNFHEIIVDESGQLAVRPHLGITLSGKDTHRDFDRIVRCFLPDLKKKDGSYDFVLGYSQSTVAPFVRVITDFVPPQGPTR